MDFMYKRESKQIPNYNIYKNIFDYIDIKIWFFFDINEWNNIFGKVSGK